MRWIASAALVVLLGAGASAHHAHPDFDLSRKVTVTGMLESMVWKNGHVLLTLRTADSTLYSAEWQGANQLYLRYGCAYNGPVTRDTLKVGDFLVVVGAPPIDPARHELVVLSELSRPSDQWHWNC